jgi:hypothetical protein
MAVAANADLVATVSSGAYGHMKLWHFPPLPPLH